ncbi:protein ABIL3 isoform X1 [Quercus suber]
MSGLKWGFDFGCKLSLFRKIKAKELLSSIFSIMGTMTTSSTLRVPYEASNFDEVSMQQSLIFADSLKDLKNLRTQLYSAAEYFELSYTNDDQNQIVVETLKDYTIKALVNTVDHLGSITYKVNDLLDEKVDEASGTELRVSSIEQVSWDCFFNQ